METEQHPTVMPFLKWVHNRIKANKNALLVVNGATGSGKSYSCLSLAKQVSELTETPFTIEGNVAFKFTDLLKKMKLPENQEPGTVFVFEEVGAFGGGASAREWQSKANKFFFSFMQTSRHRNQIIFMNCPNFSFLEAGSRSLVHMQLEASGINFGKKLVYLRPYRVQINSRTGKFYFKYLRFEVNGRKRKLNRIAVSHPGTEMAEVYEKCKTQFTSELNQQMIAEEVKVDKRKKINIEKLREYVNKGLKTKEIADLFNCSPEAIRYSMKTKGIVRIS